MSISKERIIPSILAVLVGLVFTLGIHAGASALMNNPVEELKAVAQGSVDRCSFMTIRLLELQQAVNAQCVNLPPTIMESRAHCVIPGGSGVSGGEGSDCGSSAICYTWDPLLNAYKLRICTFREMCSQLGGQCKVLD